MALLASVCVVVLDANVQSMLARTVAGMMSNKFETEVKIKTFYIKPDLRIHAEEIQINDKMHLPMFYVGTLDAKLSLRDLASDFRVRKLSLDDVLVNLVKYENEYSLNVTDLFASDDMNRKSDEKKSRPVIYLDDFNMTQGHFVFWDQDKDNPDKMSMDYAHLDIDSIYLSLENVSFKGDSVSGYFTHLSASDKCGFSLDEFSTDSRFTVSSNGFDFNNLKLKTHASELEMDLKFIYNDYGSFKKFVDSIMIIANIRPSQLTLSDLKYFSPTMEKMPDTLQIEGTVTGFVSDFVANDFKFSFKDSTDFVGTIKMRGLPKFFETHIVGDVKKMNFTYQDISEFAIPTPSGKIPLPEMLASIDKATLSGEFYGFHNNFNTEFNLHTNVGNIYFDGAINNDILIVPQPYYFFNIHANNVNVKEIFGLDEEFLLSFASDMSGEGLNKKYADFKLNFNVDKMKILGNEFENLDIAGRFENQRFIVSSKYNSKLIKYDLNAAVDVTDKIPSYSLNLDVENADLYGLNLMHNDKKMSLSTSLNAQLSGNDIETMYGNIVVDNTVYIDSRGTYLMDSFLLSLYENYFNSKKVTINCDFFDFELDGIFNYKNIGNTFKNYVLNYVQIDKWAEKGVRLADEKQDFYLFLDLKNTETLSRLLMPNLKLSDNTSLTATFTSNNYHLYSTLTSDKVMYNTLVFNDIFFKNKTENNRTTANVTVKEFVIKESTEENPIKLGLDNIGFSLDAHNDSLVLAMTWNDESLEDKNAGKLDAFFLPYKNNGGTLYLSSSDILINGRLWNISENCSMNFVKNRIKINDFDIYSDNQSVNINGCFPKTKNDTVSLNFNNLDISNFDLLTKGKGIDIDGFIDGNLRLSGVSDKFTFLSNLDIRDVGLNGHSIGKVFVDANWNAPDTSVFIDAEVIRNDNSEKVLSLLGKYYTSRDYDNLDFNLDINEIDVSLVNSFTKGVISRVAGDLTGDFIITGSLKNPVLTGDASLIDGACQIDYLNTYYRINPSASQNRFSDRFIRFSENKIEFKDILLVDTLNNYAVAKGTVKHNYLKDFYFDVEANMDNFLGMNMLADKNTSFYGTAIASGDLKIDGPLNDIVMNINALSRPGTLIDIRLVSTATINDNFIVFVQNGMAQDTMKVVVPEKEKDKKFTFNLNADVTQDAQVNIHLPSSMGTISANGSGSIRLGYASGQLSLIGDYVINEGTFGFNFQNLVRRNFDIRQGGTITWTGKAEDADINVTGVYHTKSSISSLGIELDSTSFVNNVNVDCILRLQDKLTNPDITFGLSLPNATDDMKNTVFSIIDTTNQSVMSQQIISLLVLGTFSYSNASLYSVGASNYYNVLTNSLSSWLSQINNDLDVGVRYTPEDNVVAEELELALSTQWLNDRLTIEGSLGMYSTSDGNIAGGSNNIVGDVDVTYKIRNWLSLRFYNHSNQNTNYYSYSYEAYSNFTQGVGFSVSQSFDNIRDIFMRKNRNKKNNKNKKHNNGR